MAAAPGAHPLLKTVAAQRLHFNVVDKYGAMQMPAPIAPTMATVAIGNLRHGLRDKPEFDRMYGGSLMQHTPIAYASDSSGLRSKKHSRMGTSDKIASDSTALGITRDPLNLSVLMSQRDPVASVAVRGIVPASITKTIPVGAIQFKPEASAQFFKHASFVKDHQKGSAFALTSDPAQTSHGIYLPFGNFNEKYKHAFPLHMNTMNFGVLQSNYLIRRGSVDKSKTTKAKELIDHQTAELETAVAVLKTAKEGGFTTTAEGKAAETKVQAGKVQLDALRAKVEAKRQLSRTEEDELLGEIEAVANGLTVPLDAAIAAFVPPAKKAKGTKAEELATEAAALLVTKAAVAGAGAAAPP